MRYRARSNWEGKQFLPFDFTWSFVADSEAVRTVTGLGGKALEFFFNCVEVFYFF